MTTEIILSNVYECKSKYKGKSDFEFWKNIDIGHTLKISFYFYRFGRYQFEILNLYTGEKFIDYHANLINYLTKIELS